jgi:hypothetical protein
MYLKLAAASFVMSSFFLGQSISNLYAQQQATQSPAPAAAPEPAATPAPAAASPASTVILTDGTDVPLAFDQDISSKTAADGDSVEFVLAEDLKVGDVVVAKAGAKAVGEVTNAKKAGMMGKAGELNIRLDYLKAGSVKVHLRGSKGKEGESSTGAAVALTVLFGPIGLIKHGHDIDIKKGAPLKVYIADDTNLPPAA